MKPGITLIEVALSILLGSLVASALFMSFSQLQLATRITDSFVEVDTHSTIMMHHMSRDIATACFPEHAFKNTKKMSNEAQDDSKKEEKSGEDTQEKDSQSLDIDTVFTVKHVQKNIDTITCVTSTPLAVYDTIKPALARIVYRLVPDKEREGTFRLMRQESQNLDRAAFDKKGAEEIRAYEIARSIKSCSCTCTLLEYAQDNEQKKVIKKETSDWVYAAQKATEQKMPILPYALTVRTVFLDNHSDREWSSEFVIPIGAFQFYKEKKQEAKKETQENKKSEVGNKESADKTKKEAGKRSGSMSVMDLFQRDMDRYKKNNKILSQR